MDDMAKNFNDPQYEINENEVNEFIPLCTSEAFKIEL